MRFLDPSEFPYDVRIVNDWIPLSDGNRLWMKAWLPVTDEPVPAILEYLPYRSADWTAPRDHERHPYYAGHGYASIRVDVRGHGNSSGVPGDEYDEQELDDGVEVINWIAAQGWCTGKVGMFGISWGGFNSLMLASRRPEPLKAIVTTCSSDDRYDNDVHYFGGSMLAVDMHAWAATMLAFESRPPDPIAVGDDWRRQWIDRLEKMDPYLDEWMRHQRRDEFWKRGSVCEDYDSLDAAVMAVGGWFDPYRDTALRLVENLSARGKNVKGLIGPWAHQYPDRDLRPGPHIDFLGETLRWWDHWLKDEENDVMEEPLLRAWVTDSVRPSSVYDEMPGRWVAEESWPSPQVETSSRGLAEGGVGPLAAISHDEHGRRLLTVDSPQDTGQVAGRYFPFGNAGDLPTDQRADDGRSTIVDYPLEHDVTLLGNARARLRLSSSAPRGQVYVRLTDVAPDGSSTLITRGNLNLSSREGREQNLDFPAGSFEDVTVPLTGIGYRIPAGHVLRVAISNAYWPWVWPQPGSGILTIDLEASRIELPERRTPEAGTREAALDDAVRFDDAVQPRPLEVTYPESGRAGAQRPERLVSTDVVARTTALQVDPAYGGTRIYPDGLHFDEDTVERYWIQWDDPLSARTEAEWRVAIRRPDIGWETSLEADTRITCDAENFYTESVVRCFDAEEKIFDRVWRSTIPREAS
jgi:putative CocE/NonD family hydrolase